MYSHYAVSLPARGAWIEICAFPYPHPDQLSRSLRGERGLKYTGCNPVNRYLLSLPARGAWIEIEGSLYKPVRGIRRSLRGERGLKSLSQDIAGMYNCRSLRGERGLKSPFALFSARPHLSLPARGAWIEMPSSTKLPVEMSVAPCEGSVD